MKYYLFLGDSITDANHFFSDNPAGEGFVSYIEEQLNTAKSINKTPTKPNVSHNVANHHLCNRGHDGFTVEQLWRMISRDGIFQNAPFLYDTVPDHVEDWDFITILIGVNDIPVEVYTERNRIPQEYEAYYRQILDYVQNHSKARLILVEPFLFDQPAIYKSWQTYLQVEIQIVQKLAKEYGALFVPANQMLQEACNKWGTATITPDGIHLTESGNQMLANLWLAVLDDVL